MNNFKRKQKLFKRLRNTCAITLAVVIFVYMGIEPYLIKKRLPVNIFQLILFALVIAVLSIVFIYESKYSKAGKYLDDVELQINDCGYYLTAREERSVDEFSASVLQSVKHAGFKTNENAEIDSMKFDFTAFKSQEFIYAIKCENTDRNDVIAYLDLARQDITGVKLKRKGECIVVFISSGVDESAISLSKSAVTVVTSRYNALVFSPVIVDVKCGKVYFLGNKISRTQKLVAKHILNCELPVKEQYLGKEKLSFQYELEKRMKEFNVTDYKNGKYFEL